MKEKTWRDWAPYPLNEGQHTCHWCMHAEWYITPYSQDDVTLSCHKYRKTIRTLPLKCPDFKLKKPKKKEFEELTKQ